MAKASRPQASRRTARQLRTPRRPPRPAPTHSGHQRRRSRSAGRRAQRARRRAPRGPTARARRPCRRPASSTCSDELEGRPRRRARAARPRRGAQPAHGRATKAGHRNGAPARAMADRLEGQRQQRRRASSGEEDAAASTRATVPDAGRTGVPAGRRKGPGPFGPTRTDRLPDPGCCLGARAPSVPSSRGETDLRGPGRTGGWYSHPPTRPPGRRSARHELHGRTARTLGPATGRLSTAR